MSRTHRVQVTDVCRGDRVLLPALGGRLGRFARVVATQRGALTVALLVEPAETGAPVRVTLPLTAPVYVRRGLNPWRSGPLWGRPGAAHGGH